MILIFVTNISKWQEKSVKAHLLKIKGITDISIDFEDIDKVLRIVANTDARNLIINVLKDVGIFCEEMEG